MDLSARSRVFSISCERTRDKSLGVASIAHTGKPQKVELMKGSRAISIERKFPREAKTSKSKICCGSRDRLTFFSGPFRNAIRRTKGK